MELPLVKTAADIPTLLPRWKSTLDPLLAGPLANARLLSGIALTTGSNTLNHKLGRKLQGYLVVMNDAAVTFYDAQSTNPTADLTLVLIASGACTVSLLVF